VPASMRFYVYDDHRLGVLQPPGHVLDITDLVPDAAPQQRMIGLITAWPTLRDRLMAILDEGAGPRPGIALEDVTLRAPLPRPGKVIAAPVNYRRHQEEMNGEGGVYPGAAIATIETYAGFIKASSSVVGPDGCIELPFADRRVDHEGEVGVVIGRHARRVPRARALEYVFGYTPIMDITIRGDEDRSYRKSIDTFTPLGPEITTADETGDPADIDFSLTVNGDLRQQANTRDLIFDVARLVEYYSHAMTLDPGDVIASGTPEGVGPIQAGDRVVLSIPRVGQLQMPVVGPVAAD
jgi:2-keto-4-pentenoate hydratase/2-oxohepta-3-ene-1,7-dioic acid hydratase in catechol pathway